jgi:predicted helicase
VGLEVSGLVDLTALDHGVLTPEKMKLGKDRAAIKVNGSLTLAGLPPQAFDYRLGNRSALEWIIEQYQVSQDARSGIASDPNRLDDKEYIVRLVDQVVRVSVETARIVADLSAAVSLPSPIPWPP